MCDAVGCLKLMPQLLAVCPKRGKPVPLQYSVGKSIYYNVTQFHNFQGENYLQTSTKRKITKQTKGIWTPYPTEFATEYDIEVSKNDEIDRNIFGSTDKKLRKGDFIGVQVKYNNEFI